MPRARPAAILAALALACSLVAAPAAAASPGLGDPVQCPEEVTGATCYELEVPLDHSGRAPGTLKLPIVVEDDDSAALGVLLILAGGPGQPGVSLYPTIAPRFDAVGEDYRIVMLDQRGTGAGALDCPRLQSEVGTADLLLASRAGIEECGRLLGANRAFYATTDTVADLDLLRQAIGADTWTLHGTSYGTVVAQRYLIAHPDQVARVVLDSALPYDAVDAMWRPSMVATPRVLAAACAAKSCGFDAAQALADAVRRRGDGALLLNMVTIMGYVDPDYATVLDLLAQGPAGDPAIDGLLASLQDALQGPPEELSAGLHAATLCVESDLPWFRPDMPVWKRPIFTMIEVLQLEPEDVWPYDVRTAVDNGTMSRCRWWPATHVTPPPRVDELPDVPTLVVNGDRDLMTPLEEAQALLPRLPDGVLVVAEGLGHSVQRHPDSPAMAEVFQFLRAGGDRE